MSPETEAFLDRVRDAEDPAPQDEERVLAALNAAVAAGALGAGVFGIAKLLKLLSSGSVSGWMLGGALTLGVLAAATTFGAPPPEVAPAPAAPVVQARAPAVAPPASAPRSAPEPSPLEPPKTRQAPARASATPRPPSLREELTLLSRVQAALQRGDGAAALRLLEEHETDDRQLLAERAAARVLALCAAGRTDEARSAAAAFARRHPGSLQMSAVARSCAGKELP